MPPPLSWTKTSRNLWRAEHEGEAFIIRMRKDGWFNIFAGASDGQLQQIGAQGTRALAQGFVSERIG
jgi:hypothetical protein